MLLERWKKAHNKQNDVQLIVKSSSPVAKQCGTADDDVILVETPSPQRDQKSPDSPIPVVQVTPVSPTVPASVENTIKEQHAHEVDDEMPHDMRADVKHYLERRRHTIMANPCGGMQEQPVMSIHMPITVPRPVNYSPEKRLPTPSIFQMQAFQDRRASDGASSLAAGIAQFQAMRLKQASQADNSRENLLGSSGLHALVSSSPPSPQAGEEHDSGSDEEPDPEDVERYMRMRGKRHTLAGEIPADVQSRLCQFPMKMQRRVRTPSRERVNRDGSYVGVPNMSMSRYGARRASDGAASLLAFTQHLERKGKKGSLKEIHAEHQKLQQRFLNNGQHDALKLQQQHHFHQQQQQHQQLPSPVQQRSQHPLLPMPPSFRRLKDPRGRRFSDGPENLAATLAEFHNQLSLSQQKKQLQSIESQHPLTLPPTHSPVSPGSIPTTDFPMDEEMLERNEMFPGPDHLPDERPALDLPIPGHSDVYSPQTSPREILGMLQHAPGGAQPQEQLQKEMQRLQLEPMAGHLSFSSSSSLEGFPRSYLGPLQGEEQFYEAETAANLETRSGSLQYNAQKRGDISPQELTGTEPYSTNTINQHFLLHQNQVNGHQEFSSRSSFIHPTTSTAPLAGDIEVGGHAFMDETLNAEAGNTANLSRGGGHHRRHHTVPNDEARNDLLRQAQTNNLYKRLPFNNNLISPVASKEDIIGEDKHMARPLSPKGSLLADPMIKLESTNGYTSPTASNHMTLAFNMNMISRKSLRSILDEVRNTLANHSPTLLYKQSDLLFTLQNGDVQMQIEVCQSPELAVNGLRLRRLGGDTWEYKRLCNELLSGMNL